MIRLIKLLQPVPGRQRFRLVALSALAGLSNAGVLAVLNSAAGDPTQGGGARKLFLLLLLIAFYQTAQRAMMADAAKVVEDLLHRRRLGMVERLLRIDLLPLETLGAARLFSGVATSTQKISESLTVLLVGAQSVVLLVCVLLYIGTLSMPALLLTSAFVLVLVAIQQAGASRVRTELSAAAEAETGLYTGLRGLLDGFKEVKMNQARAAGLLDDLRFLARAAAGNMSLMRRRNAEQFVFGQAGLLVLLGSTVFLVPLIAPTYVGVVPQVTTAILFVIGSVGLIVQSAPVVAQADQAAASMATLDSDLAGLHGLDPDPGALEEKATPLPENFNALVLDGAGFRYPDMGAVRGFAVGPFDLRLNRGEVVFLTGGNGAGKSTFLRLLTGLYRPTEGSLRLDDSVVSEENVSAYRRMIGAVFGDFHLFRHLYVMPESGEAGVAAELEKVGLAGKTALDKGCFTTLDLSAGQRRRLALMLALLQDRPIVVLDEVAAEFDPDFRRHFYETMLPALKRAGKTVVAASHDDRYFGSADRILHLEDGKLYSQAGMLA